MSYAEQFFGIKENEAATLADNLAWFGEDSYVYKSRDLMMKILKSARGLLNPESNLYVLKWLRENGEDLSQHLDPGFTINIYNHDLGYSIPFSLFRFNNGSADFITLDAPFFGFSSHFKAASDASDILNLEDYTFNQYLNSEKSDWFDDFNVYDHDHDISFPPFKALRTIPGFLRGVPEDTKELLGVFKTTSDNHELKVVMPDGNSLKTLFSTSLITVYDFSSIKTKMAYRFAKKLKSTAAENDWNAYMGTSDRFSKLNTIGQVFSIHGSSEITSADYEAGARKKHRDGISGFIAYTAIEAMALPSEGELNILSPNLIPAMIRINNS